MSLFSITLDALEQLQIGKSDSHYCLEEARSSKILFKITFLGSVPLANVFF